MLVGVLNLVYTDETIWLHFLFCMLMCLVCVSLRLLFSVVYNTLYQGFARLRDVSSIFKRGSLVKLNPATCCSLNSQN